MCSAVQWQAYSMNESPYCGVNSIAKSKKLTMFKFFQRGTCNRAEDCLYAHNQEEQREQGKGQTRATEWGDDQSVAQEIPLQKAMEMCRAMVNVFQGMAGQQIAQQKGQSKNQSKAQGKTKGVKGKGKSKPGSKPSTKVRSKGASKSKDKSW